MSRIHMKDWIQHVIQSSERIAIPIMTHPGIELIGRQVVEACQDGEIHAEAISALTHYPAGATTVIMDLTVEAEAFGAEIFFPPNEVPSVTGRLLKNAADVEALQGPSLTNARVPEYLKANRLSAACITDRPVLGGCIGPFSLAGRLYDMTEIMMAIYIEPATVELLLEKCTVFLIDYLKALRDMGVNGVVIAEPAAGLLSNADCLNYSSVYVKKIIEAVQTDYFAIILHNCGNTGHCTEAMIHTGAMGYHFGNKADMVKALENCPADVLVMGNLDPVSVMKQMKAEDVYNETMKLLEKTSGYPNYILSTGCDVPQEVPMANIEAFYKALCDYNNHTTTRKYFRHEAN